jgi:hypothetical protein
MQRDALFESGGGGGGGGGGKTASRPEYKTGF